jgi:hypothetical protein
MVVCDRPGDGRSLAYGGHRVIFWRTSPGVTDGAFVQ